MTCVVGGAKCLGEKRLKMKQKSEDEDQNDEVGPGFLDSGAINTETVEDVRGLRALTVLEHLTATPLPMTLAQLAATMQVPKSSLMRLLQSMEAHGYEIGRAHV